MQAMRLLMPPAWQGVDGLDPDLRAFYEFYAPHLEPGMDRLAWCSLMAAMPAAPWTATACDRRAMSLRKNRHLTIASEIGVLGLRA